MGKFADEVVSMFTGKRLISHGGDFLYNRLQSSTFHPYREAELSTFFGGEVRDIGTLHPVTRRLNEAAFLALGDKQDEAIRILESVREEEPENPFAKRMLADVYLKRADARIKEIEEKKRKGIAREWGDVIRDLENVLVLDPNSDEASKRALAVSLNNRAVAYDFGKGMLPQAIGDLERSVSLNPNDKTAWHNLGRYYRKAGEEEKAAEAFKKALKK